MYSEPVLICKERQKKIKSESQKIVFFFFFYLSGQRYFNRHRDQLCQKTAVESNHEHHGVIVGENERNLEDS